MLTVLPAPVRQPSLPDRKHGEVYIRKDLADKIPDSDMPAWERSLDPLQKLLTTLPLQYAVQLIPGIELAESDSKLIFADVHYLTQSGCAVARELPVGGDRRTGEKVNVDGLITLLETLHALEQMPNVYVLPSFVKLSGRHLVTAAKVFASPEIAEIFKSWNSFDRVTLSSKENPGSHPMRELPALITLSAQMNSSYQRFETQESLSCGTSDDLFEMKLRHRMIEIEEQRSPKWLKRFSSKGDKN